MFRISKAQMAALNETATVRLQRRVAEQVMLEDPAWAEERDALDAVIDQLFQSGFTSFDVLYGATIGLILVAQRADMPDAAEARALTDAILFNQDHSAEARLAFFDAQELTEPASRLVAE